MKVRKRPVVVEAVRRRNISDHPAVPVSDARTDAERAADARYRDWRPCERERDEARAVARVLVHAWDHNLHPLYAAVALARSYPAVPVVGLTTEDGGPIP